MSETEIILIAICIGSMIFNLVTVCLNHKAIWDDDGKDKR